VTTREQLHTLIDGLPECDLGSVQLLIEWRNRLRDDRTALLVATAPEDDEPESPEEAAAVAEAREAISRGEVYSLDAIKREFDL
jgi:hypothetical protein